MRAVRSTHVRPPRPPREKTWPFSSRNGRPQGVAGEVGSERDSEIVMAAGILCFTVLRCLRHHEGGRHCRRNNASLYHRPRLSSPVTSLFATKAGPPLPEPGRGLPQTPARALATCVRQFGSTHPPRLEHGHDPCCSGRTFSWHLRGNATSRWLTPWQPVPSPCGTTARPTGSSDPITLSGRGRSASGAS